MGEEKLFPPSSTSSFAESIDKRLCVSWTRIGTELTFYLSVIPFLAPSFPSCCHKLLEGYLVKWKFVTLAKHRHWIRILQLGCEEQVLFIECQLLVTRYVCRWYASPGIHSQFGPMMFDTANTTALTLNRWWWCCFCRRLLFCQGSINWLSHLVNRLLIAMFAICNRFHYLNAIRMQTGPWLRCIVVWCEGCLLARDKHGRGVSMQNETWLIKTFEVLRSSRLLDFV